MLSDKEGKDILRDVGEKAGHLTGRAAKAGIDEGIRTTRRAAKRASKESAKASAKAGSTAAKASAAGKGAAVGGGVYFIEVICIILCIVIIVNILVHIAKEMEQATTSEIVLTDEGKVIVSLFEAYTDEKYRARDTDLWLNDRYGVPRDSPRRDERGIDNPDTERSQYKSIMDYVELNEYSYALCGMWKVIYQEMYAEQHYKQFTSQGQDIKDTNEAYKLLIQTYYEEAKDTDNVIIGFQSDYPTDAYSGEVYHQRYVNEAFKMCLGAFENKDGKNIISVETFNSQIRKDKAKSSGQQATTQPNMNSITPTTPTYNNKLSPDISTEDYGKYIVNITIDNLIRNLKLRVCFESKDDENGPTTYYDALIGYYYYVEGLSQDKITEQYIKNDLIAKISASASSFLSNASTGSADELVRLARSQKGNGGQKYCDALNGGSLVDWCAIYAGWLLQEGAHINIEQYGWSPGVGVWEDNLISKGLFHRRDSGYRPKVGDIIIFGQDGNRTHVGIVIEVNGNTLTTSEGNTSPRPGGGEWCTRSTVDEHTYQLTDTYIHGYGDVTYVSATGETIQGSNGGYKIIKQAPDDPSYKCMSFRQWAGRSLTAREREILEVTVTGEYGNDYNGAVMIAQCIRDALVYNQVDSVENVPSHLQYDGFYANGSGNKTDTAKKAVEFIFDKGGMGVRHRVLYMYNHKICSSAWHETQHYICSVGDVRFFDRW